MRSQIKANDVYWHHCGAGVLDKLSDGPGLYREVVTTQRDPYHIAISWANRGQLDSAEWEAQWDCYAGLLKVKAKYPDWVKVVLIDDTLPRVNTHPDKYGLYDALKRKDMKKYHKHVPTDMLDYALNLTVEVQRAAREKTT